MIVSAHLCLFAFESEELEPSWTRQPFSEPDLFKTWDGSALGKLDIATCRGSALADSSLELTLCVASASVYRVGVCILAEGEGDAPLRAARAHASKLTPSYYRRDSWRPRLR